MKSIWRIIRFTSELKFYYVLISLFTILLAAMSQLQPLFIKGAIDQVSQLLHGGHPNIQIVFLFAFLIFISDLGQNIFSNIGGHFGDILAAKLQKLMSERYYQHLLNLPQAYFDNELTGTIINRMSRGISQITNYINILSNNFLQFIFSTIFSLAIVFYYSWQVGLMLFLIYPIFIWLTAKTSNKWQNYQKEINGAQDLASGRFTEVIHQIKVARSFLGESKELKLFKSHYQKSVRLTYPQSRYWHKKDFSRRLSLNLIFLAIYSFIFIETAKGLYSIGTMVLLIQYAQLIRIPIFSISFLVDQTQRAIANTKDYFEAMDIKTDISKHTNAKTLNVNQGEVEFKQVTFSYDRQNKILNNLNFKLKPCTKTAIVGESGQGKTTITNLLLGLYGIDQGEILIDKQNIAKVSQKSLRQNIAIVFQEPALFSGSIKENIGYAKNNCREQDIITAAKAANAHEFIMSFKEGYDSPIGEHGLKLSGGQKQRIAIARAILKDAPILILDEATSSLDGKSEQLIQQALDYLTKNKTTIIIAHRLSTIKHVDQIITINKGQVDEIGSPEDLENSGGIYASLLKLQSLDNKSSQQKLKNYQLTK